MKEWDETAYYGTTLGIRIEFAVYLTALLVALALWLSALLWGSLA